MNQSTEIFENIKRICGEKNIPISKVANMAGISDYTIYTWKRRANPGIYTASLVAKALNVSLDELVGWVPTGDGTKANLEKELRDTRESLFETAFGEAQKAQEAGNISRSSTDDETIAREFRNLDRHLSTLNTMLKLIVDAGQEKEFNNGLEHIIKREMALNGEKSKDNIKVAKYIKSLLEEMKEGDEDGQEA